MQQHTDTDLYAVLGVTSDASDKDIHRAYKKLAREFHPDVNPDDPVAEERFKAISAANDVLGDKAKRAEYDEFQSMIASGFGPDYVQSSHAHPGYGFGRGGFDGSSFDDLAGGDLSDLLGQMFSQRRTAAQVVRVEIGFEQAIRGTEVTIAGTTIRIPPGVATGKQLMVRRDEGDLIIELVVGEHHRFGRSGSHLTIDVPISITEAMLGAKIKVPTFDGKPVSIRIPAGTPNGRTFRVRGRGIAGGSGVGDSGAGDSSAGDLRVTVQIEIPSSLDAEQRAALEAYADLAPPIKHPNRV